MVNQLPVSKSLGYFPAQQVTDAEKDEDFFKKCIDAGVSISTWSNAAFANTVRSNRREKISNLKLYNDIIDITEVERVQNPFKLAGVDFPVKYRNYPLLNQNIARLIGEERKRNFSPICTVINGDAVNEKLRIIDEQFDEFLKGLLLSGETDQNKIQNKLQEFDKWAKYDFKETRERMVTQLVDWGFRTQNFKETFSRGFEDLLIQGEQVYVTDIYGGEPILRKANPVNIYTLRSGESWKIEDSDIIVEDGYLPIGETINRYYEELTDEDITYLERGFSLKGSSGTFNPSELVNRPVAFLDELNTVQQSGVTGVIGRDAAYFNSSFDMEGNVRVTRVVWRGMRKLGVLTYFDENGNLQKKWVSDKYKVNKITGEEITYKWVNEWYEGTRIADSLYVKKQVLPTQSRHIDNVSYCSPGIVGTVMNVNSNKSMSLIDLGKDYQFLYNAFMYKLELLYMKNKGAIGTLPLHLIPSGWDVSKALYFAEQIGWMPIDAFNEGNRGAAMGKLAGGMNNQAPVINFDMSNQIQQTFSMLSFIKESLDELTGISPQRKGDIGNRETATGVNQSITNSSLSTEKWFDVHDNTKIRALKAWVECVKIAWKGKSLQKQYVLDDGTNAILEFDGNLFPEAMYGIDISNATRDSEMLQAMKGLAQPFLQNGGSFSAIIDLYKTQNPSSLKRKFEMYEERKEQQIQQAQQSQQESQERIAQMQQQLEQNKIDWEREKMDNDNLNKQLDRENAIRIKELEGYIKIGTLDSDKDGEPDIIEQGKLSLQQSDLAFKQMSETQKQLREERLQLVQGNLERQKLNIEKEKISAAERLQKQKDKAAMEREKLKAKVAIKNKVSGEK